MLETLRLLLKAHTVESAVLMNKWSNDTELNYYSDDGPEMSEAVSLERTTRYLERISKVSLDNDIIHFAIHTKHDLNLIGFCMIAFIDKHNGKCKVGITIGDKEQWGKGYAREALTAIIDFCFNELYLNRIGAEIYEFNTRSLRLFEGLGFKHEGRIRQAVYKQGQFFDEILLGLLKKEYASGEGGQT